MRKAFFSGFIVLAFLTGGGIEALGQNSWLGQKTETYRFGKPKVEPRKKQPKTVMGRVHLLDGSSRTVPLAFVDYDQIVAVENGVETRYSILQLSSFVMKQDSFIVLKDFKVAIDEVEYDYRRAFVQVGAVGPGFALYKFKGTMQREQAGNLVMGPGGTAMGQSEPSTKYLMSEVWFMKVDSNPNWLSLPNSGARLQSIVKSLIADDKKLSRSLDWNYIRAEEVQGILLKYLSNKTAGAQ